MPGQKDIGDVRAVAWTASIVLERSNVVEWDIGSAVDACTVSNANSAAVVWNSSHHRLSSTKAGLSDPPS